MSGEKKSKIVLPGSPRIKKRPGLKTSSKEEPKRLQPTPETMKELFALSGNICAMPDCDHLIYDGNGVLLGQACHIRAALPGGPRFDATMSNEQRRHISNLMLMCSGHHTQIDRKKYENEFPLDRVLNIKARHESNFKGAGRELRKAFKSQFVDTTDALSPSGGSDFAELERVLPTCRIDEEQEEERAEQVREYLGKMKRVPDEERDFMLSVIKRAIKLGAGDVVDVPLVHAEDLVSALKISAGKLERLGKALRRYGVGDFDTVGMSAGDEWHVKVENPSEHLSWFEIGDFCAKSATDLGDFVLRLKFEALAGSI